VETPQNYSHFKLHKTATSLVQVTADNVKNAYIQLQCIFEMA